MIVASSLSSLLGLNELTFITHPVRLHCHRAILLLFRRTCRPICETANLLFFLSRFCFPLHPVISSIDSKRWWIVWRALPFTLQSSLQVDNLVNHKIRDDRCSLTGWRLARTENFFDLGGFEYFFFSFSSPSIVIVIEPARYEDNHDHQVTYRYLFWMDFFL